MVVDFMAGNLADYQKSKLLGTCNYFPARVAVWGCWNGGGMNSLCGFKCPLG